METLYNNKNGVKSSHVNNVNKISKTEIIIGAANSIFLYGVFIARNVRIIVSTFPNLPDSYLHLTQHNPLHILYGQ